MGRILLVDGNNYVNRGYFAVPALNSRSGFPTNAIKGSLNIILSDINVLKPDGVVVAFDKSRHNTWRRKLYLEYKSNRDGKDGKVQDLYPQFKPIKKLIKALGIRTVSIDGEEADDIIATLACQYAQENHQVIISSNDKDFAQLVGSNIKLLDSKTRKTFGEQGVVEKFGVRPSQIVEYLMLLGDSVDNIPGVYKCGPKTASKLLNEYKTLKNILKNLDKLTPALRTNIENAKPKFKLTRTLLTLKKDVEHTVKRFQLREPDVNRIDSLCEKLDLVETRRQIRKTFNI